MEGTACANEKLNRRKAGKAGSQLKQRGWDRLRERGARGPKTEEILLQCSGGMEGDKIVFSEEE